MYVQNVFHFTILMYMKNVFHFIILMNVKQGFHFTILMCMKKISLCNIDVHEKKTLYNIDVRAKCFSLYNIDMHEKCFSLYNIDVHEKCVHFAILMYMQKKLYTDRQPRGIG